MDPPADDRSPRSKSIANICRSFAGLTKKQKQICRRSPDVTEAAIKVIEEITDENMSDLNQNNCKCFKVVSYFETLSFAACVVLSPVCDATPME